MRRTTQWAVFTSMNRQQPARSLYEPAERAGSAAGADSAADPAAAAVAPPESDFRTAPDTRRDRVDFM